MLQIALAPLAACFLLAPEDPFGSQAVIEAAGPPMAVPVAATLTEVVELGERALGESYSVIVQARGLLPEWEPYLSRFDPRTHLGVEVWADEQLLWIEDEYKRPLARLFSLKDGAPGALLESVRIHDRLELEIAVRELHAGVLWIEVTGAALADRQTPEGTVLHAISALDLMEREAWRLAISEFDRALAPKLPEHVRVALQTLRDQCQASWDAHRSR